MLYGFTEDPFSHISVTNEEKLTVKTKSTIELEEIYATFTYPIAQIPIFFKDKRRELPREPVFGNICNLSAKRDYMDIYPSLFDDIKNSNKMTKK